MDYFKKIERSVTISADKRSTVDLQVDVWSQDLNVTKFILKLDTTDSAAIDLTNATVRVAMVYSQDGQDVKIEAAGIVEDVATQKIAYIMSNRLAGFEGTVTAGFYVTLSTGQRIDIQNVTFNMRKSLLDKDLDVPTEDYYQTFDDIVADVQSEGERAKVDINAVLPTVNSYADTQKQAIDNIVSDVQSTGDTAKAEINATLPTLQGQVSELKSELVKDLNLYTDYNLFGLGYYERSIHGFNNVATFAVCFEFNPTESFCIKLLNKYRMIVRYDTATEYGKIIDNYSVDKIKSGLYFDKKRFSDATKLYVEISSFDHSWGYTYDETFISEVLNNIIVTKTLPNQRIIPYSKVGYIKDTNQSEWVDYAGFETFFITLNKGECVYFKGTADRTTFILATLNDDRTRKQTIEKSDSDSNNIVERYYVATEREDIAITLKFGGSIEPPVIKTDKTIQSHLRGKKICFIGDSYVANHTETNLNTWHKKLADMYDMQYVNLGINGDGLIGVRNGLTPVKDRLSSIPSNCDYIIVIGGENDANISFDIDDFKTGIGDLMKSLTTSFKHSRIAFFTPWNATAHTGRAYIKPYIDAIVEQGAIYGIKIHDSSKSCVPNWDAGMRERFYQNRNDSAHLNDAGHNRFFDDARTFIESI